jgi:dihydropteroate synthase
MGILNITPDSFYDGGRYADESAVMDQVRVMIESGADIIDIGGCSTRPGARVPDAGEESERVFPILKLIRVKYPDFPLSLDTFRAGIAEKAIADHGVDMINDISGGEMDSGMFRIVTKYQVPFVMMHMRGSPATMQTLTEYDDILKDLLAYFAGKIERLRDMGLTDVIIDPGFGFAKTLDQNFYLLKHLSAFRMLNTPVLAGLSRKSMIYKYLNINASEALPGTMVLNTIALLNGADILRVHDVKEAAQAIALVSKTVGTSRA